MSGLVFVDESKQRDYLLVAAVVMPADLAGARKDLRALVMPGQRRLHMKKESDARRRAIVDAVPDAIAWCWAKGGDWRRRIAPAVTTVRQV